MTEQRRARVSIKVDKICRVCRQWCATSQKQIANRRRNLLMEGPSVYPCPQCDSIAWATCEAFVAENRSVWQRVKDWLGR